MLNSAVVTALWENKKHTKASFPKKILLTK